MKYWSTTVALLLLFVAAPSFAEQDPNLARGFSPGEVYDYSGIDTVNLFNGNLTLALPIGGRYPVGDGLSYGLVLSYNSTVWDHSTYTSPQGNTVPQSRPRRSSNAGLGWTLSLGGTLYLPPHAIGIPTNGNAIFESEDGAQHVFYSSLHEGESSGCSYTRDGSYLRLCGAGPTRTVELPDGTIRTFSEVPFGHRISTWDQFRYRLTRIADRLGNSVDVTYDIDKWTITDSVGRQHTVRFARREVDGEDQHVVSSVELDGFGDQTAVYGFASQEVSISRSCKDRNQNTSLQVDVWMLTQVTLPAGAGRFAMPSYFSTCGTAKDRPGTLARLDLPTGGRLEWAYTPYRFTSPDPEDPVGDIVEESAGVFSKTVRDGAGACYGGSCTWTYSPIEIGSGNRRTTVTTPLGDQTVHYFRALRPDPDLPGFSGWDYGLPYTDAESVAAENGTTLHLARRIYDGAVSGGTLLRSVWVAYERDRLNPTITAIWDQDWTNSNRRPAVERTLYHDDEYEDPPGSGTRVPRFTERQLDDFDGLGHYRLAVSTGDLRSAGVPSSRREFTRFNPSRGSYEIDPATNAPAPGHSYTPLPDFQAWVLGTYDRVRATEGGTVESRYCFDPASGRLERERRMAATTPGQHDVILDYGRNRDTAQVILYQTRVYGGDVQTVTTAGSWCTAAPSAGDPIYRRRETRSYGVPSKGERLTSGGQVFLVERTQVVDPYTGLVSRRVDAAGLATDLVYDAVGRLLWIKPESGGGAWTQIAYTTAAGASPARAHLYQRTNGSTLGGLLREARYTYDPFGRLATDEIRVPGHSGWQAVRTTYNALGWRTAVTERGSASATGYLQHDPFGRPGQIRLPDYPAANDHRIELAYNGVRLVSREVSIATTLTGGESRFTSAEIYDNEGRLRRVKEPSGAGGDEVTTDYAYDPASRLEQVKIKGPAHDQVRSFSYDGRGFLLSETHPENGITRYRDYDPLGHAGRVTTGPNLGPFDRGYTYDAAERLAAVREWGGRELKSFTYGNGTTPGDRSNGKLETALRHNWVPHPDNPFALLDIQVTEEYFYAGTGGRVSSRETRLNTGQAFTQGWSYDDLGRVATTTYPACLHQATCNTAGNRHPRTVARSYEQGMLTAVAGFADEITYHPNGMLAEVHHDNGNVYGQGPDPHGMRRPASLYLERNGQLLPLGPGLPSLAGQAVPLAYAYDGAGNVTSWGDERYRYDGVSRIVETAHPNGSEQQAYTYDPYGNLTAITTGSTTVTFGVDPATNRLSASSYDDAGNLTQRPGGVADAYRYDALSTLWHRGGPGADDTYIYTADDERLWSVDATTFPWRETFFLRDLDGTVLRTFFTDDQFAELAWHEDYVRRDGQPLATVKTGPGGTETVHHFHPNHLGTPLLTTDEAGANVGFGFLYPYGQERHPELQPTERIRFTGHERDFNGSGETDDLDYMHARYCSPMLGRFLSVDPLNHYQPTKTPQRWNRYSYAQNNPLLKVDPDGRDAIAVTYVGYRVSTPIGRRPLGHSGITIVKGTRTTYFEFGRYNPTRVRYRGPLPDLELGDNGLPTKASLTKYVSALTAKAGQNRPVEGAYFVNDQPDAMLQYAREREADASKQGEYSLFSSNCATFCEDVLEAGGEDLDVSLFNTPGNIMQELQDRADFSFKYDPAEEELTITCSGSVCPE